MSRRVLVLALVLVGCAEADDAGSSREADLVSEALALLDEPWCQPFAETFCAAAARCGCEVTADWPDDCVAAARAQCQRDLRARAEGLAEDGFLVSRDGVPRCLELLSEASASCRSPDPAMFETECRLVVPRLGATFPRSGELCANGLCARGLRCAFDGRCRTPRPEGGPCFTETDCVAPLTCRQDCVGASCHFACVQPPEPLLGTQCGNDFGGCFEGAICHISSRRTCAPGAGRCFSDFECADTELCGGFDFATCTPRPALGEFCGDRLLCQPGLACATDSLLCRVAPGLAEPCSGMDFGLDQCGVGLVCRDRICSLPGRDGDPCVFGLATCADGFGCDFDESGRSVCTPHREVDERCQSDDICGPTAFCDFSTVTCQPRAAEGERCSTQRCVAGLQCVEAFPGELMCARVEALGDPCSERCPAGLSCQPKAMNSSCVVAMCGALRL